MALPAVLSGSTTPATPAFSVASPSKTLAAPAASVSVASPDVAAPAAYSGPSVGPHPGTLEVYEVAPGGATSEDPAVAYDTVSYEPILNVYETLATYNGNNNTSNVPVLATCVPGTPQCVSDYGSTLIDQANGQEYTGSSGQPIYWTFVIDGNAKYYDPSTGKSWGVYPTDVMFSEARDLAWDSLIGVGSTAGWLTGQALLPNGSYTWDGGIHAPYNNTPGDILGSMMINDTAYCPAAAIANEHGCITFNASGGGSDWPFFLQLIDDGFAGAVVPCGWFTYENAGIPGWTGTAAAKGDGPCKVPQLGHTQSTTSPAWASYLGNLTSTTNTNPLTNMTSWDSFEEELLNYPAPQPNVQWNMVGSGPYYAHVTPTSNPPGYTLTANPAYAQPAGCVGADGLAAYTGDTCFPAAGGYIPKVEVYYEPSDAIGISEYRAGQADFAGIQTPEIGTMLELQSEGKLNYLLAPSLSTFFIPINLDWSATTYSADSLPAANTPNVPSDFFSGQAARSLLTESYPYAEAEATAWTVDGIPTLYEAGGPIAQGMDYYPSNVSFPYTQNGGNPNTNPNDVGGAAWWWAQGTDSSSPYYDPDLAACLTTTCTFPLVGELGDPGLDTAISEWIPEIESITSNHVQPTTFDLPFGGPGSLISDQLVATPGQGPLTVWNLGWAPDNFDPQDYMLPLAFPNSTYTYGDAVWEQFNTPTYDDVTACGHATDSYANLVYWYHQTTLKQACEGVAYDVANYWNNQATHVASTAQRGLDYNMVDGILNSLALYIWYGQATQITSYAPWIAGGSVNTNPSVGGGNDQFWFMIQYTKYSSPVTFSETGLPTGTSWSVTFGSTTESSTGTSIAFAGIPNGTYPFAVNFEQGYNATPASGNLTVTAAVNQAIAFTAVTTPTYAVTFNEAGLISNTTWSVVLAGVGTGSTNQPNLTMDLPNGTYSYYPPVIPGYSVSPAGGMFTVNGTAYGVDLTYTSTIQAVYNVTFVTSGLPGGDSWSVNVSSATTGGFELTSTSSTITFAEPAGTYTAQFTTPAGYEPPTKVTSVVVSTNTTVLVPLTVAKSAFPLVFQVTGLPALTPWSITLPTYNLTVSTTAASLTYTLPNGTVHWNISAVPGYVTTTRSGLASVNGATTAAVTIAFQEFSYAVTFFEGGLPSGATWSVTVNSVKTTSSAASLAVSLPNGTYAFTVTAPAGYEVVSQVSSIVVNGAANSTVIVFGVIPASFEVTFTESGLSNGQVWTVAFDGTSKSSTVATGTTTITFSVPNGTWSFGVTAPSGYTAATASGDITVNGAAVGQAVAFSANPKSTPSSSYLSKLADELVVALAILAIIGFALAAVMARRRPPAAPPPKGWSEGSQSTTPTTPTEPSEGPDTKS